MLVAGTCGHTKSHAIRKIPKNEKTSRYRRKRKDHKIIIAIRVNTNGTSGSMIRSHEREYPATRARKPQRPSSGQHEGGFCALMLRNSLAVALQLPVGSPTASPQR